MAKPDILGLVGTVYEAATGGLSWQDVGVEMCRALEVQRVYLGIAAPDGSLPNRLATSDPADAAYAGYYHKVDPFRRLAAEWSARGFSAPTVRRGSEIMSGSDLTRSEYYCDYARARKVRHSLGGQLDREGSLLLGVFRDTPALPFTDVEIQDLSRLLPHLGRALQLQRITSLSASLSATGPAILDMLPFCLILVDVRMQVAFMNQAAERLVAASGSVLRVSRTGCESSGRTVLNSRSKDGGRSLRKLVEAVIAGGAGGAMRLCGTSEDALEPSLVSVLVSPAPTRLTMPCPRQAGSAIMHNLALITARDLKSRASLPTPQLMELFGLSRAEAAVAIALLGGRTAEHVAIARNVSLDTIRRQIQIILRKTSANNLRDFERIAATLASMHGEASLIHI